jgi:hypothetical protein
MRDPIAVVRSIYDHVGLDLTPTTEHGIRVFLADHRRDQYGLHRYSFADTGLDSGELLDRTRRYREFFDVELEE